MENSLKLVKGKFLISNLSMHFPTVLIDKKTPPPPLPPKKTHGRPIVEAE